jgi:hypothetical protein
MRTSSGASVEGTGSSMSRHRSCAGLASAAVPLSILLLVACLISMPLDARAQEPGRKKTTGFPSVEDVPPSRENPAMTTDEQAKLKKELGAARDRQTPKGKSSGTGVAPAGPAKP